MTFSAIHINHCLHEQANEWQVHCEKICKNMSVPLVTEKADATASVGQSPEEQARRVRYQAIASCMNAGDIVLTAQHRDDQAETLLLQLFRGAGPSGLASMPVCKPFPPGYLARPLLEFSREQILHYAQQHQLQWVEDRSNQDARFDRNFIRHDVLPLVEQRWPGIKKVLSRAADHQATAASLLSDLGEQDFDRVKLGEPTEIHLPPLLQMRPDRAVNCLRFWLESLSIPQPSTIQMQRIVTELLNETTDSNATVCWHEYAVKKYQDRLYLLNQSGLTDQSDATEITWDITQQLDISGIRLTASNVKGSGVHVDKLKDKQVIVRFRQGGESIRPFGHAHTRQLKKLLQESSLPPWQRHRLPLIYINDELVAVPGICTAHDFTAIGPDTGVKIEIEKIDTSLK